MKGSEMVDWQIKGGVTQKSWHCQRVKMGQKGREKIIKEFDERIVINKYLETIDKILGNIA